MSKSLNPDSYPEEYLRTAEQVLSTGIPVVLIVSLKTAKWVQTDFHSYGRALKKAGATELHSIIAKIRCRIIEHTSSAQVVFEPKVSASGRALEIKELLQQKLEPKPTSVLARDDFLALFGEKNSN